MMTPQKIKTQYHFAGDGKIPPMNIEAENREEAEKEYKYRNTKGSIKGITKAEAPSADAENIKTE